MSRFILSLFFVCLSANISIAQTSVLAKQYKEQELRYTEQFIKNLGDKLNQSFEEQLAKFEDEELGFWSSYSNMFALFDSEEEQMRAWALKGDKYFNPISIEQLYHAEFAEYQKTIKLYRQKFSETPGFASTQIRELHIPEKSVSLQKLSDHARNNVWIEATGWLFDTRLFVVFVTFISALLGIPAPPAWIVTLAGILVNLILTNINDNNLVESLREQRKEHPTLNVQELQTRLTDNINQFYENK